jgi:hypothetical protein
MPSLLTRDNDSQLDDRCLEQMRELCCWWSEVGASRNCPSLELRQRLQELRPLLARWVGSCAAQADFLLLADLDQLVMRLGICTPGQGCWADLSHAIGLFLSELSRRTSARAA